MTWITVTRQSSVVLRLGLALLTWVLAGSGCSGDHAATVGIEGTPRPRNRARQEREAPSDAGGSIDTAEPSRPSGADAGAELIDAGTDESDSGVDVVAASPEPDRGMPDSGPKVRGSSESAEPSPADAGTDAAAAEDASQPLDAAADRDAASEPDAASDLDAALIDAEVPDAADRLTYYRDAKPIIDAKCTPCHYQAGIGPFPLTSYTEVSPLTSLIRTDVESGLMPPWLASGELDVFVGDRRLNDQQKSTLSRWIDQGALAGDAEDASPSIPPDRRTLDRVDLSLSIPVAYTPELAPDDYRCFVLEWPYAERRYITGVSIEPDRTQSVHHAILYLEPPSNALNVLAQDAADSGPGFQCFTNINSLNTWVTSYEPGGFGQSLPSGVGFEVDPGSLLVLQIHYNTFNGIGPDRSRVDLEIADSVAGVGTVAQLVDPAWLLGLMPIPAGRGDVAHSWRGRPDSLAAFQTYDIQWVDLHMHTLGSSGSISIVRSGRGREPLLEIPDWEFHWQQTYVLREPVQLYPGDQLEVECHFDNTAEHQSVVDGERLPVRDVNWGERTTDEMCLGNVLVTPAR